MPTTDKNSQKITCKSCGATMTVGAKKGRLVTTCPFCHSTELVFEDSEIIKERIRNERIENVEYEREITKRHKAVIESKKEKNILLLAIGCALVLFLMVFLLILLSPKECKIPQNSNWYKGKSIEETSTALTDAGFKNVSSIDIYEEYSNSESHSSKSIPLVEHITIKGQEKWRANEQFSENDPITIYYYYCLQMTEDESNMKWKHYSYAQEVLSDIGFKNIELKPNGALSGGLFGTANDNNEGDVSGIVINDDKNKEFKKGEFFPENAHLLVYYYSWP